MLYKKKKHDIIKKYRALFDAAIVHTRGVKPEKLLETRRPSEPDDVKEYRLSVFEPITKSDFARAITEAKRGIFNDAASFSASESLSAVVEEIDVLGKGFLSWVRDSVVQRMFEDANGCIVWWPLNPGASEALKVAPLLLYSFDLEHKTQDSIKWKVGTTEDGQPVFLEVTKLGYFEIIGVGKDEKVNVIYEHGLDYLPAVWELGGLKSSDLEGLDYLESFFCSAFAWGNKALRQDSDLEGAKTITAYPIREIQEEPCINSDCQNGHVYNHETNSKDICGHCGGKGVYIPSGPMAYIVKRKASKAIGENDDNRPALSYITPPVDGLAFLQEDFGTVYDRMQQALNQFKPDLAQSGVAKKLDLESKDASIDEVAENVWINIIGKSLEIIRDLVFWRNPESENYELHLPDTFRIKSEEEITENISAAKLIGDRLSVVKSAKDLTKRRYGNSPAVLKIADVLEVYDPFFGMTANEKMDFATAGMGAVFGYTDADFIRSGKGFNALIALSKEPDFLDMEIPDIIRRLDSELGIE